MKTDLRIKWYSFIQALQWQWFRLKHWADRRRLKQFAAEQDALAKAAKDRHYRSSRQRPYIWE